MYFIWCTCITQIPIISKKQKMLLGEIVKHLWPKVFHRFVRKNERVFRGLVNKWFNWENNYFLFQKYIKLGNKNKIIYVYSFISTLVSLYWIEKKKSNNSANNSENIVQDILNFKNLILRKSYTYFILFSIIWKYSFLTI